MIQQPVGGRASALPTRTGLRRGWQYWAPYAAVIWSVLYAILGVSWAVTGRGFPYASGDASGAMGPLAGQFGPVVAWVVVVVAGFPAAAVGIAMLRNARLLQPLLIAAGALLTMILLLVMTDVSLLIMLGYVPYLIAGLLTGGDVSRILDSAVQGRWMFALQLFCILGGFVWLAATVSYARRSANACLYCGRRDAPEGWTSPPSAARWGRVAVYVAMLPPILYALTRFAWALGIPLGMSAEEWRIGQESGTWTSGLFLASFALVGALLMLGLVQRWGEIFPSWMIGLSRRRVPIALAVIPASIVSVLVTVGGITIGSAFSQMAGAAAATGESAAVIVGPTLLFPRWGVALAVATLGYYFRRRGPCSVCGRGTSTLTETAPATQNPAS